MKISSIISNPAHRAGFDKFISDAGLTPVNYEGASNLIVCRIIEKFANNPELVYDDIWSYTPAQKEELIALFNAIHSMPKDDKREAIVFFVSKMLLGDNFQQVLQQVNQQQNVNNTNILYSTFVFEIRGTIKGIPENTIRIDVYNNDTYDIHLGEIDYLTNHNEVDLTGMTNINSINIDNLIESVKSWMYKEFKNSTYELILPEINPINQQNENGLIPGEIVFGDIKYNSSDKTDELYYVLLTNEHFRSWISMNPDCYPFDISFDEADVNLRTNNPFVIENEIDALNIWVLFLNSLINENPDAFDELSEAYISSLMILYNEFVNEVTSDYQFDKSSDDYLGFISMDPSNGDYDNFAAVWKTIKDNEDVVVNMFKVAGYNVQTLDYNTDGTVWEFIVDDSLKTDTEETINSFKIFGNLDKKSFVNLIKNNLISEDFDTSLTTFNKMDNDEKNVIISSGISSRILDELAKIYDTTWQDINETLNDDNAPGVFLYEKYDSDFINELINYGLEFYSNGNNLVKVYDWNNLEIEKDPNEMIILVDGSGLNVEDLQLYIEPTLLFDNGSGTDIIDFRISNNLDSETAMFKAEDENGIFSEADLFGFDDEKIPTEQVRQLLLHVLNDLKLFGSFEEIKNYLNSNNKGYNDLTKTESVDRAYLVYQEDEMLSVGVKIYGMIPEGFDDVSEDDESIGVKYFSLEPHESFEFQWVDTEPMHLDVVWGTDENDNLFANINVNNETVETYTYGSDEGNEQNFENEIDNNTASMILNKFREKVDFEISRNGGDITKIDAYLSSVGIYDNAPRIINIYYPTNEDLKHLNLIWKGFVTGEETLLEDVCYFGDLYFGIKNSGIFHATSVWVDSEYKDSYESISTSNINEGEINVSTTGEVSSRMEFETEIFKTEDIYPKIVEIFQTTNSVNVYDIDPDKFTNEELENKLSKWSKESIISWLKSNDPNGDYDESEEEIKFEDAIEMMVNQLEGARTAVVNDNFTDHTEINEFLAKNDFDLSIVTKFKEIYKCYRDMNSGSWYYEVGAIWVYATPMYDGENGIFIEMIDSEGNSAYSERYDMPFELNANNFAKFLVEFKVIMQKEILEAKGISEAERKLSFRQKPDNTILVNLTETGKLICTFSFLPNTDNDYNIWIETPEGNGERFDLNPESDGSAPWGVEPKGFKSSDNPFQFEERAFFTGLLAYFANVLDLEAELVEDEISNSSTDNNVSELAQTAWEKLNELIPGANYVISSGIEKNVQNDDNGSVQEFLKNLLDDEVKIIGDVYWIENMDTRDLRGASIFFNENNELVMDTGSLSLYSWNDDMDIIVVTYGMLEDRITLEGLNIHDIDGPDMLVNLSLNAIRSLFNLE